MKHRARPTPPTYGYLASRLRPVVQRASGGICGALPLAPSGGTWGDASPQTPAIQTVWRIVGRVLVI